MFYLITNNKTKLYKLILGWEFNKEDMIKIEIFYKNHPMFTIERLE